jgi:hypothetical protein
MELDFADVRPSVISWVIVGLMAVTFIVFAKFVVNKWIQNDEVKNFVNAV